MEPITQEKLEALREHVQTLRDYLDVLRLEYDTCGGKKKRHELLEEIVRVETEIDPLYCDLLAAEDAIQQDSGHTLFEKKFEKNFPMFGQNVQLFPEDNPEEDLSLQPVQQSWIGRLVTNSEGKDVFRVMFVAEGYVRLEKQRLLQDPVRWVSLENKPLTYGREYLFRLLSGSEIFFPYPKSQGGTLSPFWIGKLVEKNGILFRVMSKCSQAGAWKVCEITRTESGALLEGESLYICEDSTGWKLAEEEKEGSLKSSWVGKIVQKNGKVYRLISRDSKKGICEVVERRLSPSKEVIESPVYRVSCRETGWSLALDKGKEKV
ncbi:hypothetical protein ISTM_274 [Insectomime virus]|uniref:Uncharacterized protein n=1 Tax=Tunisvirus fontaine2 TaxID=1421067 RepID=V9SG75_9VIRU|nr:hypothetical protein D1R32_gp040 [Tunisvirus fontaine2]AHA46172.1 hypothetical protein ISTM_274 [Insectomime virus]AHC54757.1 hypothetical protein TNS_ORF39 [Tunisvirus fontaine2]